MPPHNTTPKVPRPALTPHQRIMRAARRGTGLRLSADEIWRLSQDDAIATCATNDDERMRNPEAYDAWDIYDYAITADDKERALKRLIELGELPDQRGRH